MVDGDRYGLAVRNEGVDYTIGLDNGDSFPIYIEDLGNNMYAAYINEAYLTPIADIPSYGYNTIRTAVIVEHETPVSGSSEIVADLYIEADEYLFKKANSRYTTDDTNIVAIDDFVLDE